MNKQHIRPFNSLELGLFSSRVAAICEEKQERALQSWAQSLVLQSLAAIPNGQYQFDDYLDDDGYGQTNILLKVTINVQDNGVEVDFSGTAAQVQGNLNCPCRSPQQQCFMFFAV